MQPLAWGGIPQGLWVPTPQLKKHLHRRSSHRFNRALCTIHVSFSSSRIVSLLPGPGKISRMAPDPDGKESHIDLLFTTENGGWGGGGNPPSWGNTPQPVNREESIITLLSQPASLAMLIGMCNGLLIRSNLGSPAQRGLWGGGLARGWGLLRVLPRRAGSLALGPALQNDVLIRHPNPAAQLGILGCCSCVRVYLCARVHVCTVNTTAGGCAHSVYIHGAGYRTKRRGERRECSRITSKGRTQPSSFDNANKDIYFPMTSSPSPY